MIQNFDEKKHSVGVSLFLTDNCNDTFYVTIDNLRQTVKDKKTLKKLQNESVNIYIAEEHGDVVGIIALWKSIGNNVERYYIKINAPNLTVAKNLLTILLWNAKYDMWIKLTKKSPLIDIFYRKGFVWKHDRGSEILLWRKNTNGNSIRNYSGKD